jgi:DNA-binding transcriptional ArsR family regulator
VPCRLRSHKQLPESGRSPTSIGGADPWLATHHPAPQSQRAITLITNRDNNDRRLTRKIFDQVPGVEYIELHEIERRPLEVAVSPFSSLLMATRDAAGAERSGTPEAWCHAIRMHLTTRDYEILAPLSTAARVHAPDAICPVPRAPGQSLKEGLERVVASEEQLIRDIHLCVSSGRAGDWTEASRNPRRWVRGFVLALARAWNGFAPVWQLAQDSLAHETERVVAATERGSHRHILDALLPHAQVTHGRWEIEGVIDDDIGYGVPDDGLIVMPLVAGALASMVYPGGANISHVGYPLRPVGFRAPLRPPSSASLEALLGIPRARILRELERPASNSGLAEALRTVPSAATHHVSALETAGLVARDRTGRHVTVRRTARGEALLALYDAA